MGAEHITWHALKEYLYSSRRRAEEGIWAWESVRYWKRIREGPRQFSYSGGDRCFWSDGTRRGAMA